MSKPSLLERLRGKAERAKLEARAGYRELVEAIADGRDFGEATAERILQECGYTIDDAAQDAAILQERRRLRAIVDADEETATERKEATAALEALKREKSAELERITADFNERMTAAQATLGALQRKHHEAETAREKLRSTVPPWLVEK